MPVGLCSLAMSRSYALILASVAKSLLSSSTCCWVRHVIVPKQYAAFDLYQRGWFLAGRGPGRCLSAAMSLEVVLASVCEVVRLLTQQGDALSLASSRLGALVLFAHGRDKRFFAGLGGRGVLAVDDDPRDVAVVWCGLLVGREDGLALGALGAGVHLRLVHASEGGAVLDELSVVGVGKWGVAAAGAAENAAPVEAVDKLHVGFLGVEDLAAAEVQVAGTFGWSVLAGDFSGLLVSIGITPPNQREVGDRVDLVEGWCDYTVVKADARGSQSLGDNVDLDKRGSGHEGEGTSDEDST